MTPLLEQLESIGRTIRCTGLTLSELMQSLELLDIATSTEEKQMTPNMNPNPMDVEGVRKAVRQAVFEQLGKINQNTRINYEAALVAWKGEADRAAGNRQPLPPRPPVPSKWVLGPDTPGNWDFTPLLGGPIEYTDVQVVIPYQDGYFGPGEFLGINPQDGTIIYGGEPGDQYENGAIVTTSKGKFQKVRNSIFHRNGGGYWIKIG